MLFRIMLDTETTSVDARYEEQLLKRLQLHITELCWFTVPQPEEEEDWIDAVYSCLLDMDWGVCQSKWNLPVPQRTGMSEIEFTDWQVVVASIALKRKEQFKTPMSKWKQTVTLQQDLTNALLFYVLYTARYPSHHFVTVCMLYTSH